MDIAKPGGYSLENIKSKIPEKWICPLCNKLMKDVIQTYRGEVACESCFLAAKGDGKMCPLDGEPIEDDEFFKDIYTRRSIFNLEGYCLNKANGCNWEGYIQHFEEHVMECTYKTMICQLCGEGVLQKYLNEHQNSQCACRKVACKHCSLLFDAKLLKDHESMCHMKPVLCPYMCGEPVQLNVLASHLEICTKIAVGLTCPYKVVGCRHKVNGPDDMKIHLNDDMAKHAALTVTIVKTFNDNTEKMQQALNDEKARSQLLEKKMEEQNNTQKTISVEMMRWKDKFQELEVERAKLHTMCDRGVAEVQERFNQIDLSKEERSLREVGLKLTEIEHKYGEVETKLGNNPDGSSGVHSDELKDRSSKLETLENGSAVLTSNLAELELKLQLLENTCYEGSQLWKIDNVEYRRNSARNGSVSALHSAPCYQKRGGYKFCSRLYLNGDGMGRSSHLSLFFVVMKSEYDSLLQWPFGESVTFKLIHPTNPQESVKESFIPDRKSSSFARPKKDMNIAAGCPLFLKLDRLREFIVDDTIYIETSIAGRE